MSLRRRFLQTAAILLADHYNKQEGLAQELREVLGMSEAIDLRPVVSKFISGRADYSAYCEALPVLFSRDIVAGDYPHFFVNWLDRAYASYDLEGSPGKHDRVRIRTLLAESHLLFDDEAEPESSYPRLKAARHLMRGIAIGVERRTLSSNIDNVRHGLDELKTAILGFRELRPRETSLSESDKFHIALAVHMSDWLLSELNDEEFRKQELSALNKLGAIDSFAWLAELTNNWIYVYNVAESYGEIGDIAAGKKMLIKAIELNPRLADFDVETKFDGVDEPLSEAPALQRIIPEIKRTRKQWLDVRVAAFKEHAELYGQDVNKGIKAMRKTVKDAEREKGQLKRRVVALALAVSATVASPFLLDLAAAIAKPIF
jgi:hypothetical protein